jgi:hypothetical protein
MIAALHSKRALLQLKRAAQFDGRLLVSVAIVTTALANVPGIGDAKANWNSLAKALEVEYPGQIGNSVFLSRSGWIADDREAFLHAITQFSGDLQKLSGLCYNLEGQVDQIRDAYNFYWIEIGALVSTVIIYVAAAYAMRLTPHLRPVGEIMLARLTTLTNLIIAQKTKVLGTFLTVVTGTLGAIMGSMGQMFNMQPTGGASINFERAVISTAPPSVYLAPKREEPTTAQTEEPEEQPEPEERPEPSELPEPEKQPVPEEQPR